MDLAEKDTGLFHWPTILLELSCIGRLIPEAISWNYVHFPFSMRENISIELDQ
jgi:hypothetical protein